MTAISPGLNEYSLDMSTNMSELQGELSRQVPGSGSGGFGSRGMGGGFRGGSGHGRGESMDGIIGAGGVNMGVAGEAYPGIGASSGSGMVGNGENPFKRRRISEYDDPLPAPHPHPRDFERERERDERERERERDRGTQHQSIYGVREYKSGDVFRGEEEMLSEGEQDDLYYR